jgi:hypothetical protein
MNFYPIPMLNLKIHQIKIKSSPSELEKMFILMISKINKTKSIIGFNKDKLPSKSLLVMIHSNPERPLLSS